MGVSMIDVQRDAVLRAIRNAGRGEWRVLVLDEESDRLLRNVVKEDDILAEHIANIEKIEQRRQTNRDLDAIYLLSAEPHIVDCLLADFERRRYRRATVLWTSLLHASLRERIDKSRAAKEQIIQLQVVDIGFFPRESNIVTFRDPYSFPVLYHPGCNNLVRQHLAELAQKIVSVCVSLGEYPSIRYYRPRTASHEASVLCSHLARFVQDEIDMYAQYHPDFPPPSSRPRGTLCIVDRSMDLVAPIVHEFTYQAMIHDLLPLNEGDVTSYAMMVNDGESSEKKDVEILEKDKIWVANRHRHMKDTIEKLMGDFQKFIADNPHFTNQDADNATSLNAIKDMLAGLPQFQEMKEAYSLHLAMAQDSMNLFEKRKLPDLATIEQTLATGLDEDYRKPKGMADQVIRNLDEESVGQADRLRLLVLFMLFSNGILPADAQKLLAHAQLPPQDGEILRNLELLGAKVNRQLKEKQTPPQPLFPPKPAPLNPENMYSLSRYETNVKRMLEDLNKGLLEHDQFPYTKPTLEPGADGLAAPHASLRGAKPTWARTRSANTESRQRLLIFMAGGATYSEARACYETMNETNKDVYLMTSHMITPSLYLRQVGDLSVDKRKLMIPMEQPKPKAPAHLFEPEAQPAQPKPPPQQQQPQQPKLPTTQMANMRVGNGTPQTQNGRPQPTAPSAGAPRPAAQQQPSAEGEKKKKGMWHKIKKELG